MPVSDPDVSRLRLIRDASFLEADRREIALRRGRHNRLGLAYQVPSCVCSADGRTSSSTAKSRLTPPSSRCATFSVYFCTNLVSTLTRTSCRAGPSMTSSQRARLMSNVLRSSGSRNQPTRSANNWYCTSTSPKLSSTASSATSYMHSTSWLAESSRIWKMNKGPRYITPNG